MNKLIIKNTEAKYGLVSLGEVMLRFNPGNCPVAFAKNFEATEGGGEYNVARNLRTCYDVRTALISANVKNDIGDLLKNLINAGGVDQKYVKYFDYDGIGKDVRVPLNFVFQGSGELPGRGTSDRANSAMGMLEIDNIKWDSIFCFDGVKILHTGGICAGISARTPVLISYAIDFAKTNGTLISYDLNYRPSQWQGRGGKEMAQKLNREIVKKVDIVFGDFYNSLGIDVEGFGGDYAKLDLEKLKELMLETQKQFPNLKVIATTKRKIISTSINDYMGIVLCDGEFYYSNEYKNANILDRVGGGDAFVAGVLYGVLENKTMQKTVEYGTAHALLTMSTPGDWSMINASDIENKIYGNNNMMR